MALKVDPYDEIYSEVVQSRAKASGLAKTCKKLEQGDEYEAARKELGNELRLVDWNIMDAKDLIRVARKKDPPKFSAEQLQGREKFIDETAAWVADLRESMPEVPRVYQTGSQPAREEELENGDMLTSDPATNNAEEALIISDPLAEYDVTKKDLLAKDEASMIASHAKEDDTIEVARTRAVDAQSANRTALDGLFKGAIGQWFDSLKKCIAGTRS